MRAKLKMMVALTSAGEEEGVRRRDEERAFVGGGRRREREMEKCARTAGYGAGAKEVLERINEFTRAREATKEAGVVAVRAAGRDGDLGALAASLGGDGVMG